MLNRRNLAVALVAVFLLALLAGCSAAAIEVPDREVQNDIETALAAQDKAIAGLMMGGIELTESEFSSLLTALIAQNLGADSPIQSITAWFTPEQLFLSAMMADGSSVDLVGNVGVVDNRVVVDLAAASAMGLSVAGPMLDVVETALNRALDDPSLGVAVDVATGDGTIMIGLQ